MIDEQPVDGVLSNQIIETIPVLGIDGGTDLFIVGL